MSVPTPAGSKPASSAPAPPTQSDATLRQLALALKKSEAAMSPEVQSILDSMSAQDSKEEIRTLKEAADRLGKARKTVQQTRAARLQMQDQWRKFVAQGVQRWQGFAATCKQQEVDLEAQISAALEDLKETKKVLSASRSKAAGSAEIIDGGEISDEDFMAPEPVAMGASIQGFVDNLTVLQRQAEESYEQECKRQRKLQERQVKLEQHDAAMAAPGMSLPSLTPFGRPEQ